MHIQKTKLRAKEQEQKLTYQKKKKENNNQNYLTFPIIKKMCPKLRSEDLKKTTNMFAAVGPVSLKTKILHANKEMKINCFSRI